MKSTGISTKLTAEGPSGPSKIAAHLSDMLWRTLQIFNLSWLLFVGVLLAYLGLSIKHGTAAGASSAYQVDGSSAMRTAPFAYATSLPASLPAHLDAVERRIICQVLDRTRFNRTQAAELLGISFRQLRYRMQRLDIHEPD